MTAADHPAGGFLGRALLRNNGIARRMIVALVLFSSVITAAITALELYLDYRIDLRGIDERIESIRKVYLPTLIESVWVAERTQIQMQLEGLLNLTDIEYVGVVADGETKWAAGRRRSVRQIERFMMIERPHRGRMVHIGDLHVVASVDDVLARIWSKLLVMLASNGIKTLLVTGFLLSIFQLLVGRHLEDISDYLRSVGRRLGGPVEDLRLNRPKAGRWRPDALDHVTAAINGMRRDLSASLTEVLETNQKLGTIIANSPLAIYTADTADVVMNWSPAARSMYGWSDREVLGKPFVPCAPEHARAFKELAARTLAGETIVGLMTQHRRRDGAAFDVSLNMAPLRDSGGRASGYLVVTADITLQLSLAERLRQSQKLEAIGQLTGGVAHDFNNLLAIIYGNLQLVEEIVPPQENVLRMLQTAIRATKRGATLTRSLLAFARQQPLQPQLVDVDGLVREMTELLRRTMPENIDIRVAAGAEAARCEADPGELQNALLNLALNARDAMPDGGRLTIETGCVQLDDAYAAGDGDVAPGNYVLLAVSDTGTGMSQELRARAFEPFFTTKDVGKGTGLGLSMVYGFAKQSGGHVQIDSEIGAGTTVRLYLPRVAAAHDGASPQPALPDTEGRGETILLVEDDPDVRSLTAALLRSLGYHVLDAREPQEALRLLREHSGIALLLTDVMLPGTMNGPHLAREALRLHPALRVLYMSGYTENTIMHQGRVEHGVALLQKPFSKSELAARLRTLLDNGARG